MIHKVSNASKVPAWIDNISPITHESISKSAYASFSTILVEKAKSMKLAGMSFSEIAASFKISETVLIGMIEDFHKAESERPTRPPEEKIAAVKDEQSSAQQAYEALYGTAQAPSDQLRVNDKTILSGNYATDQGGPRKQMNTVNSPSIFDPSRLERLSAQTDAGERIKAENAQIDIKREEAKKLSRYQTISGESLKDALASTIQSKAASISSAPGQEAHSYAKKMPSNGMSMFDNGEFSHLDATPGEKMVLAQKKEAEEKSKEKPYTLSNKQVSTSSITKSMINSMLDSKE